MQSRRERRRAVKPVPTPIALLRPGREISQRPHEEIAESEEPVS